MSLTIATLAHLPYKASGVSGGMEPTPRASDLATGLWRARASLLGEGVGVRNLFAKASIAQQADSALCSRHRDLQLTLHACAIMATG